MSLPTIQDVLDFWFEELTEKDWFNGGDAVDAQIKQRFLSLYEAALEGQCLHWQTDRGGSLALLLLFDQFPRNMFRKTPRAYATDGLALDIAKQAIALGHDQDRLNRERQYYYLPFEHAEDCEAQAQAVRYAREMGDDRFTDYAIRHLEIIARFGRFPHRNAVLGRLSTQEETAYLEAGNAGF